MILRKLLLSVALVGVSTASIAQFSIPKVPGLGGGSEAPANGGAVVKQARDALVQFTKAEFRILEALGGYEAFAAQEKLVSSLKTGDAAASGDDIKTVTKISGELHDEIEKRIAENKKLDDKQKKIAAEGTFNYVKGLVATKKLVGSIQGLAKNPASLGFDLVGPVTTLGTELPRIVPKAISTSGTIFKYMSANGVDISQAKKAADDLGK